MKLSGLGQLKIKHMHARTRQNSRQTRKGTFMTASGTVVLNLSSIMNPFGETDKRYEIYFSKMHVRSIYFKGFIDPMKSIGG